MFRTTSLKHDHYAGHWVIPAAEDRNDLKAMNKLGYDYAVAPDSPEKEAKLLQAIEGFHGYLMKYVCMVIRGTIPNSASYAGRDSKEFLRTLAPRGSEPSKETTDNTCKSLHLAFKNQTTEDIYNTMVFCFVKAARRYDPHYAEKVKQVCEEISGFKKQFTVEDLETRVDFPCTHILRSLVRKGFLSSIVGKKKVIGYQTGAKWPAPVSFFESGPIGFVYVLQIWFRYFLKEFIESQMFEVESDGGVLQLDPLVVFSVGYSGF